MEYVPLEKKTIPSPKPGVERLVPALHRDWVQPREWMVYQRPPVGKDIGVLGAKDAWMERSSFVLDDLEFLLSLPHHTFWSYVVYDVELAKKLSRLLTLLPRQHDMFTPHPDPDISATLCDLHKATFSVFLRMSSYKESPENFISPSAYGKIIYDNFVFDIAKIMDICTLFFLGNPLLVRKMIQNLFTCQPAYHQDLQKASVTISEALEKCLQTIKDTMVFTCTTAPEERRLCDVITYAVDTIVSVSNLVNVYEKAAESLESSLYQPLLELYESGLVPLQAYLRDQNVLYGLSKDLFDFLLPLVMHARLSTILIYRSFISNNCIKPLMETEQKEIHGEEFWKLMSNMLSEPAFLRDYNSYFAIQDDLDLFAQAGCEIDLIRVQYLNQALKMAGEEIYKKLSKQESNHKEELPPESYAASLKTNLKDSVKSVPKPSAGDMDKLVGQVRDLMPDLGDGFIQMCLKYYDHNPELVINALLEENLPPHLIGADRQLKAKKEKPAPPSRFNVHDGDEFDVNTNDTIDKQKVRIGKKNLNSKSTNALLNNKTELLGLKDHFAALSIVSDIVYGDSLEYEDEYDDTYDDNMIGEREPDDEMTERRPFVTPRALRGKYDEVSPEREHEKEANGPSTSKPDETPTPFDFARNPEEIRAEADRKRQAKMARRGIPINPPNRDVVGAAKGHGQSQQVINNRARKTENKGKHHRAMADRKMAKGMF